MVVGYVGGGVVTRYYGYFTIFVTMQVLSAISVMLAVASTETLVPEMRQRHVGWKQANIVGAVAVLGRNRNVAVLAAIFVFQLATRMGVGGVAILYVRHMFNWKPDEVTYYLAVDAACKGLALFVTIPVIERVFSPRSFFRQDLTLIRVREACARRIFARATPWQHLIQPIFGARLPPTGRPLVCRRLLCRPVCDTAARGAVGRHRYVCVCVCARGRP